MNRNQKFGIEIEFATSDHYAVNNLTQKLRDAGIDVQSMGYTHQTTQHWKIVTDSSCGYELVSPPMTINDNGLDQIYTVCRVLNENNFAVDNNCGLHVHIDASNYSVKQMMGIISAYIMYEKHFDLLMPLSRRADANRFCHSNLQYVTRNWGKSEINRIKRNIRNNNTNIIANLFGTRYMKINTESYVRHGTLEFRQHSGTLSSTKIVNWIVILLQFADVAKNFTLKTKPYNYNIYGFKSIFKITRSNPDSLISCASTYIINRVKQLNPNLNLELEIS